MSTFVGIDLGTTNSVVAAINAYGRPEVVPNRDGSNVTPSVIYFGVDPPAVGEEAKEWGRTGSPEIASFFKPHMGNPLFRLSFGGREYDATDLSAIVLKRLKEDAEARLGQPVDRAVITVPAYFADHQRTATIEAGRRAGLDVLAILNEPTAAALAYGLQKTDAGETVLIYDLGGGTFDVTVARIEPDEVAVLATAGDHDLGGKNWDDRIATFLAEKFAAETGIDPLDNPLQLNEVLTLAERAKWALSERSSTRITLQLGTERRSYELSRTDFEGMTFPLMDRTRRLTEEALGEANLSWRELAGVLLVGGSTRMPMVRNYVAQMSGKPARAGVNVDEVVALGAVIRAAMEQGTTATSATPQFRLGGSRRITDVMAHSLGVVAVSEDGSRYVNDIIIRRNVPIPAEGTRSYSIATHGGRNDSLEIYLTQGESDRPLDCSILGKYVFSGIQATDAEVTIDVRLSYDANGVVQVQAVQRDTKKPLEMAVEPVPDDLSWLGAPPVSSEAQGPIERLVIFLMIDASSSMIGEPTEQARAAAHEFLGQLDFTRTEVGLISFASDVVVQAEPTDNPRKLRAAIDRLEAGGSTNLTDALELALSHLRGRDARRYIVLLTDGFPDSQSTAVRAAERARESGIDIVAIGMGEADEEYLRKLASTEAGSVFAQSTELVQTFGRIARVIAGGGRGLRKLP